MLDKLNQLHHFEPKQFLLKISNEHSTSRIILCSILNQKKNKQIISFYIFICYSIIQKKNKITKTIDII
jgi:hypothetical protein